VLAHVFPQRGLAQGLLHQLVQLGFAQRHAGDTRPEGDVIVDRLREGVGLLKDHADALAQAGQVKLGVVDIFSLKEDLAFHARTLDGIVHAVQTAQEGGLAAARGADQGSDLAGEDVHVDVF